MEHHFFYLRNLTWFNAIAKDADPTYDDPIHDAPGLLIGYKILSVKLHRI